MRFKFDKEEQEILDLFEKGKLKSAPNLEKRKEELQSYARETIRKDKRINIRISQRVLMELKRQAYYEGLPYQTYVASILHKFANGRYTETPL